jgi:hypothetical protein
LASDQQLILQIIEGRFIRPFFIPQMNANKRKWFFAGAALAANYVMIKRNRFRR